MLNIPKIGCRAVLMRLQLSSFLARLHLIRIAILRYHSVQYEPELYLHSIGGIVHPAPLFEKQMELIRKKFNPITMDDILLFLRGEKELPPRPVAITFDDGFADNFEIAEPILNRFQIQAAFYVTVESIDSAEAPWFIRLRHAFSTTRKQFWHSKSRDKSLPLESPKDKETAFFDACGYCAPLTRTTQQKAVAAIENALEVQSIGESTNLMMNWEQVKRLHRAGHIIGSHTMSHANLAYVQEAELHEELIKSSQHLTEILGCPPIHFSYPSPFLQPHWSKDTITATKQAGYLTAVTSTSGCVRKNCNPLSIPRIWAAQNLDEFACDLELTLLGRDV